MVLIRWKSYGKEIVSSRVSIPYRYGTDTCCRCRKCSKANGVSIPYRYGTDTREILNYSSIYLLYSLIYPLL